MSGAMQVQIDLDYPIQVDGVEVRFLTMRRPKVRDQKASAVAGKTDVDKELALFANLCMVAPSTLDELDMVDYGKLQDAYSGFRKPSSEMTTSD